MSNTGKFYRPPALVAMKQDTIEAGMSGNGEWNAKQLTLVGVGWPPFKGWRRWLDGKLFPKSTIEEFIRLRGKSVSSHKRQQRIPWGPEDRELSREFRYITGPGYVPSDDVCDTPPWE